jgi:hypothetical protein
MKRPQGNGDTRHVMVMEQRGPGYVVFSPENVHDVPDQYFAALSMRLSEWLKENPRIRVRETLPFCDTTGQTILLHVWFDTAP